MKKLQPRRIGQQFFKIGRAGLAGGDLNDFSRAVAARQLHDAQTVPTNVETQSLGVDRHCRAEIEVRRQIAAMNAYGHCALPPGSRSERRVRIFVIH